MEILKYPHYMLRLISSPIDKMTPEIYSLIEYMNKVALKYKALGLAAIQLGKPVRVIITTNYLENQSSVDMKVYINPIIIEMSQEKVVLIEGCLSLPNTLYQVSRYSSIHIQDMFSTTKLSGLEAAIVQHEINHLDGILIRDIGKHVEQC